jgi:hypothetical protein
MKVIANYIEGKSKTEIYKTGNDIYYNGAIYRLPESSFETVVYQNGNDIYNSIYWDNEVGICLFVDNLENLEKTDWEFEEIPEAFYETCPVIEIESNEIIEQENNEEST